jgi:hypothetical protein
MLNHSQSLGKERRDAVYNIQDANKIILLQIHNLAKQL